MPTNPTQHQLSNSAPGARSEPPSGVASSAGSPSGAAPSGASSSGIAALRAARRHRATLLGEIHLLGESIAAPARDPGWRRRVVTRLGGLRVAFIEHMVLTEGPEGLYAELLEHAPRLARGVHVLIREHAAVVATMDALLRRVELPEVPVADLRAWTTDLLRALSRHRQRGADLVYAAYQTDIGGET